MHPRLRPAARKALAMFHKQSRRPVQWRREFSGAPAALARRSCTAHAPVECQAAPGRRALGKRPGRRRTVQAAARAAEHARHVLQHVVRLQLVLAHKPKGRFLLRFTYRLLQFYMRSTCMC